MPAERLRQPFTVSLSDGTPVTVRPIRLDDAPHLQALHARLSPESIYLRWLAARPALTDEEARDLSNVDSVARMAFVAALGQGDAERIIGVARYGRVKPDDPSVVEAAVVVEDAYQGRGLGSALIERLLRYSHAVGVRTWVAEVNAVNARMLRFMERDGLPVTRRFEGGAWQVQIDLSLLDDESHASA
jgi:RimJ/RimL family protein N-acetyltransferase